MMKNSLYKIDGVFLSGSNDSITMSDTTEHEIASAKNSIISYGDETYCCEGDFSMFGNSYIIENSNGDKIAEIKVDVFGSKGLMSDDEGNVIARFDASIARKDYIVSIYGSCGFDDEAVLMMFASYFNDIR